MTETGTGPAYRIETDRLVLRCWQPADAQKLKDAIDASADHLYPWMRWVEQGPQTLEEQIELLRGFRAKFDTGEDFVYGVFDPEETAVLGGTGLHTRRGDDVREIGYWIHVDHINKGLATELAAAVTKVAFEVDEVRRVEIHCNVRNVRSAAIPRKLGFVHEATRRQFLEEAGGEYCDTMIWTLFADEYQQSPAVDAIIAAYDAIGRKLL